MLTIAIATHNGASTLPHVLEGYALAAAPPSGWQLLLLDNASTDGTPELAKRFAAHLPLVYLREARRGKNVALNAGIPRFAGDLVVFSDDDAVPSPDFLVRWSQVAPKYPGYTMFGGSIRPLWSCPPPPWVAGFGATVSIVYAITAAEQAEGPIQSDLIWGPNMAVRREVFDRGFRFDEGMGPQGRTYPMGGETSFTLRLSQAGYKGWFLPDIVVNHIIRPRQLEREWVRQRAFNFGRGRSRLDMMRAQHGAERTWRGVPLRRVVELLKYAPRNHLRYLAALALHDEKKLPNAEWHTLFLRGYLRELLSAARENG
jgi:glycosyltransferase involved in cell wall biosynthesis